MRKEVYISNRGRDFRKEACNPRIIEYFRLEKPLDVVYPAPHSQQTRLDQVAQPLP